MGFSQPGPPGFLPQPFLLCVRQRQQLGASRRLGGLSGLGGLAGRLRQRVGLRAPGPGRPMVRRGEYLNQYFIIIQLLYSIWIDCTEYNIILYLNILTIFYSCYTTLIIPLPSGFWFFATHLENMSSSIEMIIPNAWKMFETTNQE